MLIYSTFGEIVDIIKVLSITHQMQKISVLCFVSMPLYIQLGEIADIIEALSISSSDSYISLLCFISVGWGFIHHLEILLML